MSALEKARTPERAFLDALASFDVIARDVAPQVARLEHWRSTLRTALELAPPPKGLKPGSALASQAEHVRTLLRDSMARWEEDLARRAPMRQLAETFGDRAVLLVFGKVNAGKSSFCNYLVDRFRALGMPVEAFVVRDGALEALDQPFSVGATETTATIQGVRVGEQLVLLDSPGLHSITAENGDLTQRFIDSADGVLWLTSSTSPGQVQELAELKRQLAQGKPLLPVITKSDIDDEDEVDGQIVMRCINKTADNRHSQQADVLKRARQCLEAAQLDPALVREPVSLSVQMARLDDTAAGRAAAGIDTLFRALREIVAPARGYKRTKAATLVLNHLEADVLAPLERDILPQLARLEDAAHQATALLAERTPRIASAVVAEVLGGLSELLEAHKESRDIDALYRALSARGRDAVEHHVRKELADYAEQLREIALDLNADGAQYDEETIEVMVRSGGVKKAAVATGAGLIGTVLGTLAGGPLGGVIGGAVAGWLGDKGGDRLLETHRKTIPVGISYDRLYASLEQELRRVLPDAVATCVGECRKAIGFVAAEARGLAAIVDASRSNLAVIKEAIRHESV